MAELSKKTLEHLAELARINLNEEAAQKGEPRPGEAGREKLLNDLQMILGHFGELQALDTSSVQPMTGGTNLENVLRNDENATQDTGKGLDAFPENKDGYLKVPPVF
ncbi:MAG: Asp-tRNA(Asn)/Glu-tRNA(Gln) amidotransferase subunit GatC [bacterium]|nr:Asp-tRNA(Asn)/Glu-tRNA(Gln) amidotransferase subunit GatC [bacterium]